MDKKKVNIALIIATLALVGVLGVAMFKGSFTKSDEGSPDKSLAGVTDLDTLRLGEDGELGHKSSSSTNVSVAAASSTQDTFLKAGKLYIGSGQRIDSWFNPTGQSIQVFYADAGFNSGTASSSFRIGLFATTTGPSQITRIFDYTALTEAINGANSFLIKNFVYATSTAATTTTSHMALKDGFGSGSITVPASGYLHFLVQQGDLLRCISSGSCETASSSARGPGDFFARFFYFR